MEEKQIVVIDGVSYQKEERKADCFELVMDTDGNLYEGCMTYDGGEYNCYYLKDHRGRIVDESSLSYFVLVPINGKSPEIKERLKESISQLNYIEARLEEEHVTIEFIESINQLERTVNELFRRLSRND